MKLSAIGRVLTITGPETLVSNSVNEYVTEFTFDSSWAGFTKAAVFRNLKTRVAKEKLLDENDSCVIPWEVLTPGNLVIGIYGTKGEMTRPTLYAERQTVSQGTEPADPAREPTPDLVEQVMNLVVRGQETQTADILAAIDQAVFDKQLLIDILAGTCENLAGDAITGIADYVFYNKTSLKTINLPNCISVGEYAFYGCSELTEISLPMIISVGQYGFSGIGGVNIEFPHCTSLGGYAFRATDIETVNLPAVKTIPGNAFYMSAVKSVTLENCETVGYQGFYGCNNLIEVNAPKLKEIGGLAFSGCKALSSITIDSVESIESRAFEYCEAITQISLPKVTELSSNAFYGCKNLERVELPELETYLDSNVFNSCENLASVYMPKITTILKNAFTRVSSLKTIDATNIVSIAQSGFYWCYGLEELYLPSITSIGQTVFYGCTALRKVFIGKDCAAISASRYTYSPFYGCTNTDLQIFCEAPEQPSGWDAYWNYYASGKTLTVHWGATREEYEAY